MYNGENHIDGSPATYTIPQYNYLKSSSSQCYKIKRVSQQYENLQDTSTPRHLKTDNDPTHRKTREDANYTKTRTHTMLIEHQRSKYYEDRV